MLTVRLPKPVMVASLALFARLVAADNVADYGGNEALVRDVPAVDATFPRTRCAGARSPTQGCRRRPTGSSSRPRR
jgi:predicted small integral membrane protein